MGPAGAVAFGPPSPLRGGFGPFCRRGLAFWERGLKGTSVNMLIIESLSAEVARVRADKEFSTRANLLLKRDKELLDRLAR